VLSASDPAGTGPDSFVIWPDEGAQPGMKVE
jgi:hypothetical protein